MKSRLKKALGLICYIIVLGLLFRLDFRLLFQPKPFLSVVIGMLLLTACQYRKGMTWEDVIATLRWNLILAGFLTTLISFFSPGYGRFSELGNLRETELLLPLLYGSMLYLLLGVLPGDESKQKAERGSPQPRALTSTETAEKVCRAFALTKRECHVAQKMLTDMSNKEIAADLYISEATVKKHIQNIYQKFGVSDRVSFRVCYFKYAEKS
jgi:DNA-binding CsgD family transcriptional regulator